MRQQIFYHEGSDLTLSTRVEKAQLSLDENSLAIYTKENTIKIKFCEIKSVQLIKIYKIGTVIRIDHDKNIAILSVVRFMIGQFAVVNLLATRKLIKQIQTAIDRTGFPSV